MLDAPCGNGRLSIPLAKRGYVITGVDITDVLVEEARASSQGMDVEIVKSDMRELPWTGTFDAAFCLWGSFGYFDDVGNRRFLEQTHRSLKSEAKFVLDIPNIAETLLPRLQNETESEIGQTHVVEKHSYRHEESRFEIEWTLTKQGISETKTTSMRVYGFREAVNLFDEARFSLWDTFSSLEGDPYELRSSGILRTSEEMRRRHAEHASSLEPYYSGAWLHLWPVKASACARQSEDLTTGDSWVMQGREIAKSP